MFLPSYFGAAGNPAIRDYGDSGSTRPYDTNFSKHCFKRNIGHIVIAFSQAGNHRVITRRSIISPSPHLPAAIPQHRHNDLRWANHQAQADSCPTRTPIAASYSKLSALHLSREPLFKTSAPSDRAKFGIGPECLRCLTILQLCVTSCEVKQQVGSF